MWNKECHLLFISQPGDGVVFMAQTLEKIYREQLTLLPKPECEVKGRKASEGISQHPCVKSGVELRFKVPPNPFICIEHLYLPKDTLLQKTVSAIFFKRVTVLFPLPPA